MRIGVPIAVWQWGYKTDIVPNPKTATDKEMFDFLIKTSGPDYFAEGGTTAPFFVQAAKELGYYGYDTKPFKGLLSIEDAKGYLNQLFVPQSQKFVFDKYLTDLNTVNHLDLTKPWWSDSFTEEARLGDNLYIATGSLSLTLIRSMYATFYNKEL